MKKLYPALLFFLLLVVPALAQQTVTLQGSASYSGSTSYSGSAPYASTLTINGLPSGCVASLAGTVITVTNCPTSPPVGVTVTCLPIGVAPSGTVTCSAAVTNAANLNVTWSSSAGTISATGVLTAPTTAGTITVTAHSVQDSTKSGSAAITVMLPATSIKVESESTTISSGPIVTLPTTDTGGGSKLNCATVGQTYDYNVVVPTAGTYVVAARLGGNAGATGTGTVHFEFPVGANISGPLSITNPAWATVSAASGKTVTLPAGTQTIRMVVDALIGGQVAVNWFTLTPTFGAPPSVKLMWNPSTSPAIIGYNVYRSTVDGGPYSKINGTIILAPPYIDVNVASGSFYSYVATVIGDPAIYTPSESVYSNQAAVTAP